VGISGVAALVGIDVRGGDLLAVGAVALAALGYAVGPVIVSLRLDGLPGLGLSAVALGMTALAYLPLAWFGRPDDLGAVSGRAWGSVVVLGTLCSAVAFLVFFALVAEVGPSRATVITYVNPAVAVLLGVLLLAEPLTAGIVLGFPLVLLGSYLATRGTRTPGAGRQGSGQVLAGGSAGAEMGAMPASGSSGSSSSSASRGGSPSSRAASSGTSS
jgi:drug/metabolite transporter (DMT)-like permease